jgi:hypothetical protein
MLRSAELKANQKGAQKEDKHTTMDKSSKGLITPEM